MKYFRVVRLFLCLFIFAAFFGALSTPALADKFDPNESMMGIDLNAIDSTVKPCDDFYQYACGTWIKKLELPADKSGVARSFTEIYDRNIEILHKALDEGAKGTQKNVDSETQKLNDFYASCTNEAQVEKMSPKALQTQLAILDRLQSKEDLDAVLGDLKLHGVSAFFEIASDTDLVDPEHKIADILQGGMGLPDSTYYTSTEPSKVALRKAYVLNIEHMLALTGTKATAAKADAKQVYAIEEALAKSALTPEESSDPTVNYHPVTVADLKKDAPIVNWETRFKSLGIAVPKKLNLMEPKFLSEVQAMLATEDLAHLKTYLRYRIVEAYAPYLGKKIYHQYFDFFGKKLSGRKVPEPRWKRCVQIVGGDSGMSEALGKVYVKTTFSPNAKARALDMIANIRKALKENLGELEWLDSATRKKALEKLEKISQKIGYPDKWKDYSSLKISKNDFLQDVINAVEFKQKEDLNRVGGPVDPTIWDMAPHVVNAYYAPDLNQINFPAGILQAPFFSENYTDAENYGAIGMVIGHEITHGFDTVGSKFDGRGMMSDWWSPTVKKQFEEKAACMKKQYAGYEVLPGLQLNGDLTITENIADNGGLKIAHAAFMLANKGKTAAHDLGSFNDEQQFFLSAAQSWCGKDTDEAIRRQVSSDSHSIEKYRIIGAFTNNPDFAKAFSCAPGTAMAPKNRCLIW